MALKTQIINFIKSNRAFSLLAVALMIYSIARSFKASSHFSIFTKAASLIFSGVDPFQEHFYTGEVGIWKYSDFAALFFYPFSLLSPELGRLFYYLLSSAIFLWGLYYFLKLFERRNEWIILIIVILIAGDLFISLKDAKIEVLMMGLCLYSAYLFSKKHYFLASFLIAAGTALKFFPIIFFGLFVAVFLRRNTKKVLISVFVYSIFTAVFVLLPVLFIGWDAFVSNFNNQISIHASDASTSWVNFIGLYAFLYKSFSIYISSSYHFYFNVFFGLLFALSLFFAARKADDKTLCAGACALAGLYFLLFNHITQTNSYVAAVPAYIYGFFMSLRFKNTKILILFFLAWTCIIVLGGDASPQSFKAVYKAYKLKVVGTLLLLVISLFFSLKRCKKA